MTRSQCAPEDTKPVTNIAAVLIVIAIAFAAGLLFQQGLWPFSIVLLVAALWIGAWILGEMNRPGGEE